MRRYVKQNLTELIKTFFESVDLIKKRIDCKNFDGAIQLLSDCQNAAIDLGTFIENSEGENTPTVTFIEDYCDKLYDSAVMLSNNEKINSYKFCKNISNKLIQIENSIENDIEIQLEVVFLPYKASMWDSLESIWIAAKEDKNCNSVVIPIPYFDRNADSTFGTTHYEGEEYPDYVPITDWTKYDLSVQKPDIIYFHYPYDGNNLVTSVHPAFYSKELKKHTDMLVYIPYFVLGEIKPADKEAIEGMKHFCLTSGAVNADKVIVQSNDMRQIYINVLTEATGEKSRKYWENKILGLGSPKFDKVVNTKKENVDVPKDWLNVIQKPDGSWKKIIFYNTGLSTFLNNSDKYFDKMRDVFRIFKENVYDVALLWRPHPLMESTIKSMRANLYEEYMGLVSEYKDAGWGIYDDTADLDRAIVLSDAYYGDASSVVQLCQKAEIPIMIQNCEIVEDTE